MAIRPLFGHRPPGQPVCALIATWPAPTDQRQGTVASRKQGSGPGQAAPDSAHSRSCRPVIRRTRRFSFGEPLGVTNCSTLCGLNRSKQHQSIGVTVVAHRRPLLAFGPTARSSRPTISEQQPVRPASSTTTLNVTTAHLEDSHRSAGCNQPGGRVHLGAYEIRGAPEVASSSGSPKSTTGLPLNSI